MALDGNCGVCFKCRSNIECPQCERRSFNWAAPPVDSEDDSNLPLCNNVLVGGGWRNAGVRCPPRPLACPLVTFCDCVDWWVLSGGRSQRGLGTAAIPPERRLSPHPCHFPGFSVHGGHARVAPHDGPGHAGSQRLVPTRTLVSPVVWADPPTHYNIPTHPAPTHGSLPGETARLLAEGQLYPLYTAAIAVDCLPWPDRCHSSRCSHYGGRARRQQATLAVGLVVIRGSSAGAMLAVLALELPPVGCILVVSYLDCAPRAQGVFPLSPFAFVVTFPLLRVL
jgi:hypothetical protein